MDNMFIEYSKEKEPTRYYKSYAWKTAIGLQKVDGLEPSKYLVDTANRHIDGDISLDDANELISSYYKESGARLDRQEEADKVSIRIAQIIQEQAFSFSSIEFIAIHKRLFEGIYSHAGKIRDYNITKEEWVLDGDSVIYGNAISLKETLDYDLNEEKKFSYKGLSIDEVISHIAQFVANLWQIHVFGEGNTRVVAVFLIKYLKKLGFSVTNDIFADNAWYFRNALVRANYNNYDKNVFETNYYLELFLRNLLLDEDNLLSNREMHINYKEVADSKANSENREDMIVNLFKVNPSITLQEVADTIHKSLRTVKICVKSLQDEGRIERVGGNKQGRWIVK